MSDGHHQRSECGSISAASEKAPDATPITNSKNNLVLLMLHTPGECCFDARVKAHGQDDADRSACDKCGGFDDVGVGRELVERGLRDADGDAGDHGGGFVAALNVQLLDAEQENDAGGSGEEGQGGGCHDL